MTWQRFALILSLFVGGMAIVWPPVLGIVIVLWIIVVIAHWIVRGMHREFDRWPYK